MKFLKKLFHRHKYTVLSMYPPRPVYHSHEWGFLIRCEECGHRKGPKIPRSITMVEKMIPTLPPGTKIYHLTESN